MKKKILVIGGAGYIGSITSQRLQAAGFSPILFDNLSAGHNTFPPDMPLVVGDVRSFHDVEAALVRYRPAAVILFAALPLVWESMERPFDYFFHNMAGVVNVLEAMRKTRCHSIIFSSSCAVFGSQNTRVAQEATPHHPESFYGYTKSQAEMLIHWWETIYGIRSIILRYFNAAGASLDLQYGENDSSDSKLIPTLIRAVLQNKRVRLYGKDYPTPDGTCVRDYVHVEDLAEAHVQALTRLLTIKQSEVFNLGSGTGISNRELVRVLEDISHKHIAVTYAPARKGDAAIIRASNRKAKTVLKWKPHYSDIRTIIETAYQWHRKRWLQNR